MNNNWLCLTTLENYRVTESKNIWGVRRKYKNRLSRLKMGDKVIFYILGKKIGGMFKVNSEVYEDTDKIFSGGIYPYKIKLEPIKLPKELPAFTNKMIQELELFKYKNHKWKYELMGQIVKSISNKDYEYLSSII